MNEASTNIVHVGARGIDYDSHVGCLGLVLVALLTTSGYENLGAAVVTGLEAINAKAGDCAVADLNTHRG